MTTRPPSSASVSADTTIAPSPAPPAPSAQREFLPFAAPLVDVEPDTLNIDPALAATALTARTRAILPVHYAGHPVNLQLIDELASRAGLAVIEDAAHAMSAKYRGRTIGSGSNPAAFSFY